MGLLEILWLKQKPRQGQWIETNGIYVLKAFVDHKEIAEHKLSVYHLPWSESKISPISDEERKQMWNPTNAKGISEEKRVNGALIIEKYEMFDGFLPSYIIHFFNGDFQYGEKHSPGLGDIRSLYQDIYTPEEFKKSISEYFTFDYSNFSKLFTDLDLPEEQRNAVKSIL